MAWTTCRRMDETVLFPIANISLQMNNEAPWVNLKRQQAIRITTGMANLYLVFFFTTCGFKISASAKTAALFILNIWIHLLSSYSLSKNRENQVVDLGFTQYPRSSSKTLKDVHNRKLCKADYIWAWRSSRRCPNWFKISPTASLPSSSSKGGGK